MNLNIDPQITSALIQFVGTIIGSLLGAWAVTQAGRFIRVVGAGVGVICLMLAIVIGLSLLPKLITSSTPQPIGTQAPPNPSTDTPLPPEPSATPDPKPVWVENESRDYNATTLDEYVPENHLIC